MKSFKARCSLSCTSVLLTSNQGGKRKSESERKTREEIEKKEKAVKQDEEWLEPQAQGWDEEWCDDEWDENWGHNSGFPGQPRGS